MIADDRESFVERAIKETKLPSSIVISRLRKKFGKYNSSKEEEYLAFLKQSVSEEIEKKRAELIEKAKPEDSNIKCPEHPDATIVTSVVVSRNGERLNQWKCSVGGFGCYWHWRINKTRESMGLPLITDWTIKDKKDE